MASGIRIGGVEFTHDGANRLVLSNGQRCSGVEVGRRELGFRIRRTLECAMARGNDQRFEVIQFTVQTTAHKRNDRGKNEFGPGISSSVIRIIAFVVNDSNTSRLNL